MLQEYIPVGCVPTAAVTAGDGGSLSGGSLSQGEEGSLLGGSLSMRSVSGGETPFGK